MKFKTKSLLFILYASNLSVKFCYNCGHRLGLSTEKYCPECGIKLQQNVIKVAERRDDDAGSIGIKGTQGSVYGTGITGSGNVTGEEIGYNVYGNIFHLNFGSNLSSEEVSNLKKIITLPTQLEQYSTKDTIANKKDIKTKIEESGATYQHIKNVLTEVNKVEQKAGIDIKEIKVGNELHISRNELSLKEILLKGNEHFYKNEYNEALRWYDKALKINPDLAISWNNKGLALYDLGKHNESIECYDKALRIDPNYALVWLNKGAALGGSKKHNESIECFDKAIMINPNYAYAWNNKGHALDNLGKHEEAIECYDKALQINPDLALVWFNKGNALNKLDKNKEAMECYNKSQELTSKKQAFSSSVENKEGKRIKWYTADGKPVYE